jgi:hypothetical protein
MKEATAPTISLHDYFVSLGRKGGQARTPAQKAAMRKNLKQFRRKKTTNGKTPT